MSSQRSGPVGSIHLPAEIWQKILRHALFVPIFFDTDPIASYGLASFICYRDTTTYWESERMRNKFRRVCSSWDVYLQRFAHRFVDLVDIYHKHVPITALSLAYRLKMFMCMCTACKVHRRRDGDQVEASVPALELESRSKPQFAIEILEIDNSWLSENPLLTLIIAKSRVRAFFRPLGFKNACKIIEKSPSSELNLYAGALAVDTCSPRYLTTLQLSLFGSIPPIPPMPNLKHLSIYLDNPNQSKRAIFVDWLHHSVGSQLVTLFWTAGTRIEYCTTPMPIWTLCPLVTSLQLPSDSLWTCPPPTHPISYIRLTLVFDPNGSKCTYCPHIHQWGTRYAGANMDDVVRCGNIQTVSFDRSWSEMLDHYDGKGGAVCRHRWLKSHGIRYVDLYWVTLEEYILAELKIARRLQRAGNVRFSLF